MKTIELKPTEFCVFKEAANKIKLFFDYEIKKGIVYVEADKKQLRALGYC